MRKVFAAFNMTIDGYCDHTSGIPADEIHFHYARLLEEAGSILYSAFLIYNHKNVYRFSSP